MNNYEYFTIIKPIQLIHTNLELLGLEFWSVRGVGFYRSPVQYGTQSGPPPPIGLGQFARAGREIKVVEERPCIDSA